MVSAGRGRRRGRGAVGEWKGGGRLREHGCWLLGAGWLGEIPSSPPS